MRDLMRWTRKQTYASVLLRFASLLLLTGVATAQQPFDCSGDGYLFQYPPGGPTTVQAVNMVTGATETVAVISGRVINGVGYNTQDNFIYGWDFNLPGIVRIDANWNVQNLGIPAGMSSPFGGLTGDVDDNGHFWLTGQGGDGQWHQVDLATMTHIASGPIQGGGIESLAGGPDWAYVPGGGNYLYRIMRTEAGDEAFLFRFNRATGLHENLGSLGDLGGGSNTYGAVYADAAGFLYASNNQTGDIFRVDVTEVTGELFTPGPASSNNDGARCANAPLLLDFGDAPDSYSTLLASDGARHELRDFDPLTFTTSLMLGEQVGPDDDGQPGPGADSDAFDDGVVDPIQLMAGEPNAVVVTVTNNTTEEATLAGWIDLDATGTFDVGDRAPLKTIPANSGTANYVLDFPPGTAVVDVYARFRVFPGIVSDPLPTGAASFGEVEDYLLPVADWAVVKSSDAGSSVAPGDVVTYTLTVTNTGTGESAAISYSVTVDDPITGDGVLTNTVVGSPNCPDPAITDPSDPDYQAECVSVLPVADWAVVKSSDAGSSVAPGDVVTYTLTVTNTGTADLAGLAITDDLSGVLDDALYNNDAAATIGTVSYSEPELGWSGDLLVGESAAISYSVTVDDPITGDGVLTNTVVGSPNCPGIGGMGRFGHGEPGPECVSVIPVSDPIPVPIREIWMLLLLGLMIMGVGLRQLWSWRSV